MSMTCKCAPHMIMTKQSLSIDTTENAVMQIAYFHCLVIGEELLNQSSGLALSNCIAV